MSSELRQKLYAESMQKFNPDVGNFFDKGYIKIERKLWDQVYMNELASALTASGYPTTFLAGVKPKMQDKDWLAFTSYLQAELLKDNAKGTKSYRWVAWGKMKSQIRRNSKMMFCPYVRNNPKIDANLKSNTVDINRKAQLDFRRHAVDYFKSATFKASSARILKSYGGGGDFATGQTEEHGQRGEDEFSDFFSQPGRDIGGPQFKPGPRKGLARSQRKADQDSSLAKGQSASGARGTKIEQRIVKSLVQNMQKAALKPQHYDSFHTAVQAKWRDLFGYEHRVDTFESDKGLKRHLSMRSNMVPTIDSFNPGDFDINIGNNWRNFLQNRTYFKAEINRLLPGQMSNTFIDDLFRDSPKYSDRLIAATNKSIVKNMFTQVTNPDMRLKVNKAILAGFTTKKAKGKTATTNKGKKKSPTKTKQTQKQRIPKGIVLPPVGKVDQKAGQNPLALKVMLNKVLPVAIAKNMVAPALQYRTGRFANSVQVDDVTQGPRGGNTMIQASYLTNPYETFAPGGKKYTQQRDPERLIKRTVREVATSIVGAKFGIEVR